MLPVFNTALTCLWPFALLYLRMRAATDGKYGSSWRGRLGLELPRLEKHPGRVWMHALSVGETLSAVPLVQALKAEDPSLEIVFSTSTETGQAIARSSLGLLVEHFFIMPIDFPWAVKRLIARVAPSALVLIETDLWPNLLGTCREKGVPVFLVNGRISDSSFRRLRRFRGWTRGIFASFHRVFAQTAADKAKYEALGVPEALVRAVGNLKVDSALHTLGEKAAAELRASTGVEPGRPVWIAGSTHDGEEEILMNVHGRLRLEYPELLFIVAPRNVGRALDVATMAQERGFGVSFRSRGESSRGKTVYLLDTLGELRRFYALAHIAFIGGSLVPFGGHNPLEATAQGKFAVWGPHCFNFRELEGQLIRAECGARVSSEDELAEVLNRFLGDEALCTRAETDARRFVGAQTGPSRGIAREILAERDRGVGREAP